jgi:hypothetical protein
MARVQAIKNALAPWAARQYLSFAETQTPAAPFWIDHAHQRLRRIKADMDPSNLIRSIPSHPARGPLTAAPLIRTPPCRLSPPSCPAPALPQNQGAWDVHQAGVAAAHFDRQVEVSPSIARPRHPLTAELPLPSG